MYVTTKLSVFRCLFHFQIDQQHSPRISKDREHLYYKEFHFRVGPVQEIDALQQKQSGVSQMWKSGKNLLVALISVVLGPLQSEMSVNQTSEQPRIQQTNLVPRVQDVI